MAIIPQSQRRVTQLANVGSQRRDFATPAQFERPETQLVGQLGSTLEQAGTQALLQGQKNKRDAIMRDTVNQYTQDGLQYNNEVFNSKNQDAIDSFDRSKKFYDELRDKYANTFSNEADRERFLGVTNSNTQNSLGKIFVHQEQQRNNYDNLTIEAQNQNFIDSAVQNRLDPEYIKDQEKLLVANVDYLNDKNGIEGELATKSREASINNFNVKVLQSYGSPSASLEYLDANWDKFNPAVRTELKEKLEGEMQDVFIREQTLKISNSGLTLEQQLAEVDKIKDPDIAKTVRTEIKSRDNEKQAIRKKEQEAFEEAEWDKLFENPVTYTIPVKNISSATQRQMQTYKSKQSAEANGKGGTIDWERYSQYLAMPQEDLKKLSVTEILKINDTPKITEIIKNRSEALKGQGAEEAERTITIQQQARLAIQGLSEFDTRAKKTKRREQANVNLNRFWEQYDKKIKAIPERDRTVERVAEVKNALLRPMKVPVFGVDKTIKAYQLPYQDEDTTSEIAERNLPENLQEFANVNYDVASDQYYVDVDNVREVYDINGNLIAKGRRR